MKKMDIAEVLEKRKLQLALKRLMDVVISASALLVIWPVLLLIALAIKIDDPGPVFYRQVRVGRNGKEFRIFRVDDHGKVIGKKNAGQEGTVCRGILRRNGCHLQKVQSRVDNASTQRIVVRGTSCRSTDQKTVTAELFDKAVSNGHIQMKQMSTVAGNGDFIKSALMIHGSIHFNGSLYSLQILNGIISLIVHEDELIQFIGVEVLEESQMACIHAHKGDLRKVQLMDHTKELAVAANADDQFCFRTEFIRNGETGHFQLLFQYPPCFFG